jgi:hypothetical protein
VLGRLRASALHESLDDAAEDAMEPRPSTVRPDVPAAALARRLADRQLTSAIMTTPVGRLIASARDDLERGG